MDVHTILDKQQCQKILQRYTGSTECKIISIDLKPHTCQMDGLITDQYNLEIQYENDNKKNVAKLFLKLLNGSNPVMFEISKEIKAYEKESFFYETVVDLLQSKGINCDFVPKSYLCYPYIVVLEDLSISSYKMTTKNQPLDLDHCKKGLEVLATFHTKSIIYEYLRTKEVGKSYKWIDEYDDVLVDRIFTDCENLVTKYIKYSVEGLLQIIDIMPDDNVGKELFKTNLEKAVMESLAPWKHETRSTLLHGDLWSNNFLFKYDDDGKIGDCKMIDFQLLKYGPPASDVMQFIYSNTRKSFRDRYETEMLSFYYNTFSNLLKKENLIPEDILSEVQFKKSCSDSKLYVKLFIVIDRGITFTSAEDFNKVDKNEESFSKYIFEDRGKHLLKEFKENSLFRSVIMEDLTELKELLMSEVL